MAPDPRSKDSGVPGILNHFAPAEGSDDAEEYGKLVARRLNDLFVVHQRSDVTQGLTTALQQPANGVVGNASVPVGRKGERILTQLVSLNELGFLGCQLKAVGESETHSLVSTQNPLQVLLIASDDEFHVPTPFRIPSLFFNLLRDVASQFTICCPL